MSLNYNASVCNRVYGYLRLSFISTCVSYIFNILPVIFPLYLLVTARIQSMKLSLLHDNLLSCKVACGTIRGCTGPDPQTKAWVGHYA